MFSEALPWQQQPEVLAETTGEVARTAMDEMRRQLAERPHYTNPRYTQLVPPGVELSVAIPSGPWETQPAVPHETERINILEQRLPVDSQGRPLHPWLTSMLSDPAVGVVSGRGFFYQWGPNPTADAIVIRENHLLMVERGDGSLALPGGFVDAADPSRLSAACREIYEETGFYSPELAQITKVYSGPVADVRLTAHAWPVTTAFALHYPVTGQALPIVQGRDDARRAFWLPLEEARATPLYGSHNALLELALQA